MRMNTAQEFVGTLNDVILFPLIGLLLAVAFLVFLVGCAQYIFGANNPQAREKGSKSIMYGIIGMVVMVSAWTILGLAAGTFGITVPT
jgi:Plasma-membrane choline transporter.